MKGDRRADAEPVASRSSSAAPGLDALLLVEPNPNGHRLMYLGRAAKEAIRLGIPVRIMTTNAAMSSAAYQEFVAPILCQKDPPKRLIVDKSLSPGLRGLLSIARHSTRTGRTVVLDGDRWILWFLLAWPRSKPATLLLMRPSETSTRSIGALGKRVLCKLLRRAGKVLLKELTTPAWDAADASQTSGSKVNDPIPDMTEMSRIQARTSLGVPDGRPMVAILGAIDERKSVRQVIDWIETLKGDSTPSLLLCGRCSEVMRRKLRVTDVQRLRRDGRILVLDRFVSNTELQLAAKAASAVFVMHENDGPSGALAYAYAAGTPVIAWGSRVVVEDVVRRGIGVAAENRSPEGINDAWNRLQLAAVSSLSPARQCPDNLFIRQLLGAGTDQNLGRHQ